MRTVLVLGAGASKAYGESPTGQRMPIARDFFDTFESLRVSTHPWVLREALVFYLEHYRNVDALTYLQSGIDIEELHSEILDRFLALPVESGNLDRMMFWRAYIELIFIFACCVNVIQSGPLSSPHVELAKRLTHEDTIVTFNWDTLMDRALAQVTRWTVDAGYGVTPRSVFRDGWQTPSTRQIQAPILLKLHGSTNWLVGYPTEQDGKVVLTQSTPPSSLFAFEYASSPYDTYAGRYMPGYEPFSYGYYPPNIDDVGRPVSEGYQLLISRLKVPWKPEGTAGDSGLVSMPLIIPPVKDKSYSLFGELFTGLWASAQDALMRADHIVIIGYSFPRTDDRSRTLFSEAISRRATVPSVTVIDPSPEGVAAKLTDIGITGDAQTIIAEPFGPSFDLRRVFAGTTRSS